MSSHLDQFLSVQVYPEQNDDLQEKTPNNNNWDKEIEVGLKLALFIIDFHISRTFIWRSWLVRRGWSTRDSCRGWSRGRGRGRGRGRALA